MGSHLPPAALAPAVVLAPSRRPPADMRIYAVGDIHGRSDLLDRLHESIRADLRGRKTGRARIVYLGDYVDRGGDAAGTIERLAALAESDPPKGVEVPVERVFLKGNHEAMMLDFLDGDFTKLETWLWNGGMPTLESYGLTPMAGDKGPRWAESLLAELRRALPAAHAAFLRALAPHHRAGGLFFAHAGVRPGTPLDGQDPLDLMWIRDPFLNSPEDFGALVIHGHSITPAAEVRENRVGVDTGAWRSGRLTAAVFEGDSVGFLGT